MMWYCVVTSKNFILLNSTQYTVDYSYLNYPYRQLSESQLSECRLSERQLSEPLVIRTSTIRTIKYPNVNYPNIQLSEPPTIRKSTMSFLARQPPVGQGLLIHEASRSHTTTHHSRLDSSGRVISTSQRPLPDNNNNTHNRQTSIPPVGFEPTISAGERQ